jgi:hypothetical protein
MALMPDPDQELAAAQAALRAHLGSWEFAFANAGGCHGGVGHPAHVATRELTAELSARVEAARQAVESR